MGKSLRLRFRVRDIRSLVLSTPVLLVVGGILVASLATDAPLLGAAAIALGLFLIFCLIKQRTLPKVFLIVLGVLLLAYAFLGKGAAYLGVPPLFISEIVLALGVMTFLLRGGFGLVKDSPVIWLILVFSFWSLLNTLPYVSTYGLDAFRDAALWGYSFFAIMVSICLLRTGWIARVPMIYGKMLPIFVGWVPIAFLITWSAARVVIPEFPLSGRPMLHNKSGDMCVHLAGVAAFLLLAVNREREGKDFIDWRSWALWTLWIGGAAMNSSKNRGGMVSIIASLLVVAVFRRSSRWAKLVFISLFLISLGIISDLRFDYGTSREVSVRQYAEHLKSIVSDDPELGRLASTKEWRQQWWTEIINYTVFGPYFWMGKGYGINLANDDGFTGSGGELRSPHNGHLTVLARSGVPGAVLWILLQAVFGLSVLRAYLRARAAGLFWLARLEAWILAFWTAFMANASFDVYLEGPQGGIWFWSLIGLGIASVQLQKTIKNVQVIDRRERAGDQVGSALPAG